MIDDGPGATRTAQRALSPDRPGPARHGAEPRRLLPGARGRATPSTPACPASCRRRWTSSPQLVGRQYHLFDYVGAPDAERVIVMMGSGAEAAQETVEYLNARGEKVGVLKVRLYRPFSVEHFVAALPADRQDHRRARPHQGAGRRRRAALPGRRSPPSAKALAAGKAPFEAFPRVIGGRYGLSSKEFTPAMVKAVFDELPKPAAEEPLHRRHHGRRHAHQPGRTTRRSPPKIPRPCAPCSTAWAPTARWAPTRTPSRSSARTPTTTPRATSSTTRRSPARSPSRTCASARKPIHSTYLITQANFVACHQFNFLERLDVLQAAEPGATFLLNSPYGPDEVWDHAAAHDAAADHREEAASST